MGQKIVCKMLSPNGGSLTVVQMLVRVHRSQGKNKINRPRTRLDFEQVQVKKCVEITPHQCPTFRRVLTRRYIAVEVAGIQGLERQGPDVASFETVGRAERRKLIPKLALPASLAGGPKREPATVTRPSFTVLVLCGRMEPS